MEIETTETTLDRLNQLSEASASAREEVATLVAEVVALRGRLADAERKLEGVQVGRAQDVERVERLIGDRRFEGRLDGLEERLGAAQEAGQRSAERLEAFAADVSRLNRLESALDNVRRDVAEQLAAYIATFRSERAASEARHDRRAAESVESLREHTELIAGLSPIAERVEGLERSRKALEADAQRTTVEIETLAAERSSLADTIRRGVSDMANRTEALGVEALRQELGAWQARLEHQVITVEAAKTLAEDVRAKGEELLAAQRESAESQRVFEGRIDAAIGAVRRETADEWSSFIVQREREHEQASRALREELALRDAALQAAVAAVDERVTATGVEIERRRQVLETDLLDLRQMSHGAMERWRNGLDDLIKDSEASIPSDAKPHLVAERRRALRRSLRAARGARDEGGE